MSTRRRLVVALCAAVAVFLPAPGASAQDVAGPSLKAAYIYRFALFTEWPAGTLPETGPLTMCVVGDPDVRDALERAVRGVTVADRTVAVTFDRRGAPSSPCQVLYVSAVSSAQAARLVAGVNEERVLTISDLAGFNRIGGIAEFFYEAGQLRFAIEPEAVKQSGLLLSSRLLQLARPPR